MSEATSNLTLDNTRFCLFPQNFFPSRFYLLGKALDANAKVMANKISGAVLPLCCYGKVLDFMVKNTRLTKNTRLQTID